MQKKLINQKTKLKIWRAVRRRMKYAAKHPYCEASGLCYDLITVAELILKDPSVLLDHQAYELFPEMLEFKPTNRPRNSFWWSVFTSEGYSKRVEVCNEIIKKLEYKK